MTTPIRGTGKLVSMASHSGQAARDGARRAVLRWPVHLGLIATVVVSLVFEPGCAP